MLSNLIYCQPFIKQFKIEDQGVVRDLLDSLIVIPTNRVINDITSKIETIMLHYDSIAIYPIRELLKDEVSYFDEQDDKVVPLLQQGTEPLGSEAFISNIITNLSRNFKNKIILQGSHSPPLSLLREKRCQAILLVDDMIGSGKRTSSFIEAIYHHKTIKSWVSGRKLDIQVVSFMGSKQGLQHLTFWEKKARVKIHNLMTCPTFYDLPNHRGLLKLCDDYAHNNERIPLGFENTAVRVVFTHSAPNNLPAILHRNNFKYKAKSVDKRGVTKVWKALFPARSIPIQFKINLEYIDKQKVPTSVRFKQLLSVVNDGFTNANDIHLVLNWSYSSCQEMLNLMNNMKLLTINSSKICLTDRGKKEFTRWKLKDYHIEFNGNNYYPN
ncbi:hypothetical protein ACJZSO_000509 [Proteus mirabilis]|uniref:phosphoribosyltransferase-like protein n=1 Tax=Proteus mirabilis TaxID=584 RepID=UPI000C12B39E|nr:hypothetical protein [Proteus mirabilis]MBB6652803.1 hypothetical protein [Proteus mirabilis]HEK3138262.1 hypothetical protein [Proteus mirabilis]